MNSNTEKDLKNLRRKIHSYPEPGWCEYKTASLVITELTKLKYNIIYGEKLFQKNTKLGLEPASVSDYFFEEANKDPNINKSILEKLKNSNTAVIGILDCGKGPTILLRFDMDALRLCETNDVSHIPNKEIFRSKNSNYMHACGHDGHTAIGIFLAKELIRKRNNIKGKIILLFQPAEEGLRGASSLLHNKIFSQIDYAFGFHLWSHVKTGKIICGTNGQMASTKFNLEIYGKAAHAGLNPEKGINSLHAAGNIISKLYELAEIYKDKVKFNIGKITGGESRNIICPYTELEIETRAKSSSENDDFYNKCIDIIKKISDKHRCEHKIILKGYAESANSNICLSKKVQTIASKIKFFTEIQTQETAGGNSEDFTSIMKKLQSQNKQATYIGIGASIDAGGHHTSNFDINENSLAPVVNLLTDICLSNNL